MRATLEFDLPDDEAAHRAALRGAGYLSALRALDEALRNRLKYGTPLREASAAPQLTARAQELELENVRLLLRELVSDLDDA